MKSIHVQLWETRENQREAYLKMAIADHERFQYEFSRLARRYPEGNPVLEDYRLILLRSRGLVAKYQIREAAPTI